MDLVNHLEGRLLFAVPKKGRLNAAALNLLEGADIQFRRENRLDIALVKNLPIALIFLPAADIPTFVGQGRVDLGITGWDQVQEHESAVRATTPGGGCDMVMDLGFGGCKLQVQVPEKGRFAATRDLIGTTIGTSFVHLAADHFAKLEAAADGDPNPESATANTRQLRTKLIELSGSVEAACALGVAEGIVDLVESGETMRAAGLKAIDTVVESTAVLIKSNKPSKTEMRSSLSDAAKITPGKRAPTVTSLDEDGWVAVSSMVEKKKIALVMDDLAKVGASDILVLDLHNTR
ncbi:ATP phosphoribosyltransferase-like protein [Emericellopsis cladophorae]|uniref:ATP phosphoribosyltransferase n=1 Tax=Emericellopsis cladophorae TaxID=2686198 RepID=A0A9P9XUL2_9HYPO|nr:ATP phosphoribosyltransferase-like protein [Emericellopsis cladophorae]KAI6778089.1 ATP phosphoribosyltransferase-like protein [Emericellopsis cladophorae]